MRKMFNYTTLVLATLLVVPTFIILGLVYYTQAMVWYFGITVCFHVLCFGIIVSPEAKGRTAIGRSWNTFKSRHIVSQ